MPKDLSHAISSRVLVESRLLNPSQVQPSCDPQRTEPACAACFGTGWEPIVGKGVRPCPCRTKITRTRLLGMCNLPQRYSQCRLENYRPQKGNLTQMRALSYACRFVRDYPSVEQGLLFMGAVGVGKTHLAAAILRSLIERGVPCLFYDFGALLRAIQQSYRPDSQTSESKMLEPVYEVEVLVLDELGGSKPTEWAQDTIRQVINTRYNDKKLTLFTTNYGDAACDPAGETLADRIGVRLRSRLYEMCKTVLIDGPDYRLNFDTR
jgi:DNA replication protein DnaC